MGDNMSMTGTVVKINVHFEKLGGLTMDDYDFTCDFYVYPNRSVSVAKNRMTRIDEDNYMAVVDTSVTGAGEIRLRVTAMIPDTDCDGGFRKEVAGCSTGITIRR